METKGFEYTTIPSLNIAERMALLKSELDENDHVPMVSKRDLNAEFEKANELKLEELRREDARKSLEFAIPTIRHNPGKISMSGNKNHGRGDL